MHQSNGIGEMYISVRECSVRFNARLDLRDRALLIHFQQNVFIQVLMYVFTII